MRSVLVIFGIFFLVFTTTARAQYEVEKKDTSKKKVRVVDQSNDEAKVYTIREITETPNMIKVNIRSVMTGEFLISYERMLNKYFSAEVAAGPTYLSPFLTELNYDYLMLDTVPMQEQAEYSVPGYGLAWRLGGKFHIDGDEYPETWYIGLDIRHRRFNQTLDLNRYSSLNEMLPLKQRYTDYYLLGGYQMEISDPVYLEYNAGIGIHSRNLEYANITHAPSGDPIAEVLNAKGSAPLITIGFKIGYAF